MLYDPYEDLKQELINGTGIGPSIAASIASEITAKMQAKAIYHYGPLKIEFAFDSNDFEDGQGDITLIIKAPAHNLTWESPLETVYIEGKTSRKDILEAINESIEHLLERYASNLDTELPDNQWVIGIDEVAAKWMLANLPVSTIRSQLAGLSTGGYTMFPHDPKQISHYRRGRIAGGTIITMDGMIATTTTDLGQDVNYRCGIIAMPGLLSEIIRQQLIGQDASAIIDHPLMSGAGVIRQVLDNRGNKAIDDPIETLVVLERPITKIDDFIALLDKQDPHKLADLSNLEAF